MNWDAIGAIGEITGALAVVATLFYLAQQVRNSTRMARAEMTKDLFLASRTAIMDIAAHDRLADIWADIRPFDAYWAGARDEFHEEFASYVDEQVRIAKADLAGGAAVEVESA